MVHANDKAEQERINEELARLTFGRLRPRIYARNDGAPPEPHGGHGPRARPGEWLRPDARWWAAMKDGPGWAAASAVLAILSIPCLVAGAEAGTVGLIGVGYGRPVRLFGTIGLDIPIARPRGGAISLAGEAEVGQGGYGIRLGVDWLPGAEHKIMLGAFGRAVRTWGNPLGVDRGRSLLGGDVEVSWVKLLWTSVGILAPVNGANRKTSVTWNVGLRFPIACFSGCPF